MRFARRGKHGMTHSAYFADPDGYGIELVYDVPAEAWEGDVDAALNYVEYLDPDDIEDRTDYQRFGGRRRRTRAGTRTDHDAAAGITLTDVSHPTPAELLDVAAAAARCRRRRARRRARPAARVDHKNARTSLVTAVDLAAQREIERVITQHFPEHSIIGEEGRAGADDGALTWLVDPLDGTSNYAHGVPIACASVAVVDGAGPVAAAILAPFQAELFTASRGGGAWLGTERMQVSDTAAAARALVCTGVQSDDLAAVAAFGRRLVDLTGTCRAVRCLGSPALCLAYVAAGRVDAFLEADSTYAWDVAAGALLITEAGGRIEDLAGGPLNLGPGIADVLASNGRLHDELASIVGSGTTATVR